LDRDLARHVGSAVADHEDAACTPGVHGQAASARAVDEHAIADRDLTVAELQGSLEARLEDDRVGARLGVGVLDGPAQAVLDGNEVGIHVKQVLDHECGRRDPVFEDLDRGASAASSNARA
jgi:hypothetical protein